MQNPPMPRTVTRHYSKLTKPRFIALRLGSSLGMITTAEAVETEEQLEILRAEGCMQVQGFLFSKAVPAAEIPLLLQRLQPRIRAA
jgi:EAL domain-containing protein (putative c-di-GMP-specific phosphodiesterase class I)